MGAQSSRQFSEAPTSRNILAQAIRIAMERFQMDEDRAFQFIVRASSASNITLRDVAAELVDTANDRIRPT